MADEFEFELDVETAIEVDAAVVANLRSQLTGADDEPAQAFVNKMYQQFSDALPSSVKRTCKDTDLRQQWLREEYYNILQEYVTVVKDAYVPHIDITDFTEDERQQMENLHRKLSKQDQLAVLQLFKAEYDKYLNGLDKAVHEACDEEVLQRLQRRWLLGNYVATMDQFVTKEKDKFEFDKDFEAMAPELQQASKALLPCLRNSEAVKVEMLLNEEWQI